MNDRLVVLKFGSSVLRSEADLPRIADEIKRHVDEGCHVVAVVSAMGDSTELLIRRAHSLGHQLGDLPRTSQPVAPRSGLPAAVAPIADAPTSPNAPTGSTAPAEAAFAALLATGEATSAALVGLALDSLGVAFSVLCAGRVGPFTRGPQLDAQPHAFDAGAVRRALARRPVAILPGFVGRDGEGNFSLLGRGGSDLTALFVAHSLQADRCCLLKDIDGIYEHDPALHAGRKPRRYASLDWDGALRLDDRILQQKAAQFAYRHRVVFEVGTCGSPPGTRVGAAATRVDAAATRGGAAATRGGAAATRVGTTAGSTAAVQGRLSS